MRGEKRIGAPGYCKLDKHDTLRNNALRIVFAAVFSRLNPFRREYPVLQHRNNDANFLQEYEMTQRKSAKTDGIRRTLIALCGMNCRLCRAYMRDKNPCPGCRGDDRLKPKTRVSCRIKTCEKIVNGGAGYCFGCDSFPCSRLNNLDERYRAKYGMSMIDNLKNMKRSGIRNFIKSEEKKWTCPGCGGLLCVHEPRCLFCQHKWR
jgi:hypothetical protein